MSSLTRWVIGALCLVSCGTTWMTARYRARAAAAERMAKSGQWTDFRAYHLDGRYPDYFQLTVLVVGLMIQLLSGESGHQALRRPGRVILAVIKVGSIAYAGSQMVLRTRDHKCTSGASYASSLGLTLSCEGHEASASTPNYTKMMEYSAREWRSAFNQLVWYTAFMMLMEWSAGRARSIKHSELLDEKV